MTRVSFVVPNVSWTLTCRRGRSGGYCGCETYHLSSRRTGLSTLRSARIHRAAAVHDIWPSQSRIGSETDSAKSPAVTQEPITAAAITATRVERGCGGLRTWRTTAGAGTRTDADSRRKTPRTLPLESGR